MPTPFKAQDTDPESDGPSVDAQLNAAALARRRALLSGLGKGSAALAVLSPMASQATRSYTLDNPALPNGTGYCTVSGFHSAAISGMPQSGYTTCSAFAPSHFVVSSKVAYAVNPGNGNVKVNETATSLGISTSVFGTLSASNNTGEIRVSPTNDATNYVIYKGNGSGDLKSCTKTTLTNLPGPSLKKDLFSSVFTASSSTDRFLDLFVPLNGASLSDDAYFAAAYLSASLDMQGLDKGDIPFDAGYVVNMYGHGGAAAFFRALCTKA